MTSCYLRFLSLRGCGRQALALAQSSSSLCPFAAMRRPAASVRGTGPRRVQAARSGWVAMHVAQRRQRVTALGARGPAALTMHLVLRHLAHGLGYAGLEVGALCTAKFRAAGCGQPALRIFDCLGRTHDVFPLRATCMLSTRFG